MMLVKICGIVTPSDARLAARAGADMVGIILWPKAERFVRLDDARLIARAARAEGAEPVGVFVEESAEQIRKAAEEVGLKVVQLHGSAARNACSHLSGFERLYSVGVALDGSYELPQVDAEWLHFDRPKGSDEQAFDWSAFERPGGRFMIAGALTPETVALAVRTLTPDGVDVSGGVCQANGLYKDEEKVIAFIQAAKGAACGPKS